MAITAFWQADLSTFLHTDQAAIIGRLAHESQRRFRLNEAQQLRAWQESCAILNRVLGPVVAAVPNAAGWQLLLEVALPRTERRADAVLLACGAIIVLEFKIGADRFDPRSRNQVEDFALDLQDFHAGSRGWRIVPVLVASAATTIAPAQPGLALAGVAAVIDATPESLAALLMDLPAHTPPLDPTAWQAAPYQPVPPIIEAARALYGRHNVEDILDARAGAASLAVTAGAIREALLAASATRTHTILFVTGVPGAGKTLCGLNACFGAADDALRATFLTGNPSLVHVLREALVRDCVKQGKDRRAAMQDMTGVIQSLPAFRDHYAANTLAPAERVVVVDEAQRSWSGDYAIRKSRDRAVQLTTSEPGHLLAAMARHDGWAALICLIGQGQEIHDGEGGLAEWGLALRDHPGWAIFAAPDCLVAAEARRRLPALPNLRTDPRLHLTVPTRQIGNPAASNWVDAVLEGDADHAAAIARAAGGVPYSVTRALPTLRDALRARARGSRRAGLLASSGARRLRAEGLGAELSHMDAGAVARWFLDRWPDVRASDALELVATEFSAQGLELDVAGLCWDGDLIRSTAGSAWQPRAFRGTTWQIVQAPEAVSNRINTYRVLLTRARHHTVIYVPPGSADDATRQPAWFDAIAAFLHRCGATSSATPADHISRAPPATAEAAGLFASTGAQ